MTLFQEKQKYMYAVFERNLLSDKGKALVRERMHDFDAQLLFKDLSSSLNPTHKYAKNPGNTSNTDMHINGKMYRKVSMTNVLYTA